jgi:hypothetical protein
MKIALERHAYAPELNKAFIFHKGRRVATLPAAGLTTIRDVRKAYFAPRPAFRHAHVFSERSAPWQGLNRDRAGRVPFGPEGWQAVKKAAALMLDKGGELLDGRTLPPSNVRIITRLIG